MSHRQDQIAAALHRAVQTVLSRGLQDPRVKGLVSVTRVTIDEDLSRASVYVSVLPGEQGPLTLQGLQHAAVRIRSQLNRLVKLRRIPHLKFRLDESIKMQASLDEALHEEDEER